MSVVSPVLAVQQAKEAKERAERRRDAIALVGGRVDIANEELNTFRTLYQQALKRQKGAKNE